MMPHPELVLELQGKNFKKKYFKSSLRLDIMITRFIMFLNRCCKSMFANRISYWLNGKGPSMSVDQACCSSLAALEQAFQAMSRGECEAAIVGGTNIALHPQSSFHYSRY